MHWKVHVALFTILMMLLSGCGTIVNEVQKITGNKISIIDDQTDDSEEEEKELEKKEWVNPRPYHKVDQMVNDPGEGKYAGSFYDENKVFQAIDQMPIGLSEDKSLAYMLGLVGENYNKENDIIQEVKKVDFNQLLVELEKRWKPKEKGAQPTTSKKVNAVILLDASNSMSGIFDRKSRWSHAQSITMQLVNSLPSGSRISVHTYGAGSKDKEVSCKNTSQHFHADPYEANKQKSILQHSLSKIHPLGWSPLRLALQSAYRDFSKMKQKDNQAENMLFVVTDNGETCDGDPTSIVKQWSKGGQNIRVHIIGLRVTSLKETQLHQMAGLSLGHYENARNERDLQEIMKLNLEDIRQTQLPWQLRISDYLAREYRSDRSRLTYNYLRMNQKVDRENERLKKLIDYARDRNKINGRDWVRLTAFAQDRYKLINSYAEKLLLDIDGNLLRTVTNQSKQLIRSWVQEGKKKADFINHQRKRIRLPIR